MPKLLLLLIMLSALLRAESRPGSAAPGANASAGLRSYVLGPGDMIAVRVADADEFGKDAQLPPVRIESNGAIILPLVGEVQAAGLTTQELIAALRARLARFINTPDVTAYVHEFRSQPVSVLGQVNKPGVIQIEGRKRLLDAISEAGGLAPMAGASVTITREGECAEKTPLRDAALDAAGRHYRVVIPVRSISAAGEAADNVPLCPFDVISVSKAELVFVIGEVKHSGAFPLNERAGIGALQALAMAEGLAAHSAPQRAVILRGSADGKRRTEEAVDLKKIMAGRANDVQLGANDVLFVPNSFTKALSGAAWTSFVSAFAYAVVMRGL